MKRYIKGGLNWKLIIPNEMAIRDQDIELNYLAQLDDEISLQLLSEKLIILISILSGQIDQTLRVLNIKHMVLEEFKSCFHQRTFIN